MDNLLIEKKYISPEKILNKNINYFNFYTNNNQFSKNQRNVYDKIGNFNITEEKYHKNNYDMNIIGSNKNIDKIKNENIILHTYIKKYKKLILSKDNEIEGYKEKVKALLSRINEKNSEIVLKGNIILKLNEDKEKYYSSNNNNNNININTLQNQLELAINEIEQYKKQKIKLEQIIKNLNKKLNLQKSSNIIDINKKENEKSYDYMLNNKNNFEINTFWLTFEKNNFLYKNEDKKFYIKENRNNKDKLISLEMEIQKLNKIIEELKIKNENEKKKYKKDIEEINKNKKSFEKKIDELSKTLEEKNKEISELNEYNIKNQLLLNNINIKENSNQNKGSYQNDIKKIEEELRNNKIEIALKYRENEDLKAQLNQIKEEKVNKERIIEELNEDIENLKEINDNNKKELNDKNNNIENLIKNINELEIKVKGITDKNEEIKKEYILLKNKNEELVKDNDKLYNDNIKLKNNLNVLNEEKEKIDKKNEQLITDKTELLNKMMSIEDKKENEFLQKKVIDLNEYINDLNNQINKLNIKYQEKQKEIKNLKEASYSLINKQKDELIKKDKIENISPETHYIICQKKYHKLKWYLMTNINPNEQKYKYIDNYEDFMWVNGASISQSLLNKFIKLDDDEIEINDLHSYNKALGSKINENYIINDNNKLKLNSIKKLKNKPKEENFLINLNKDNSNKDYSNKEISNKDIIIKTEKSNQISNHSPKHNEDNIFFNDMLIEEKICSDPIILKDKMDLKKKKNKY